MSFRVRLTANAAADFERRLTTIAEQSPAFARRLNDSFEKSLVHLRDFPLSCGLAYENPSFSEELRHLLFGTRRK